MRSIKLKTNNRVKYIGSISKEAKIKKWNENYFGYNEEGWLTSLSDKINTGLAVTQEVCDNVITPLVEKQLNGLSENN